MRFLPSPNPEVRSPAVEVLNERETQQEVQARAWQVKSESPRTLRKGPERDGERERRLSTKTEERNRLAKRGRPQLKAHEKTTSGLHSVLEGIMAEDVARNTVLRTERKILDSEITAQHNVVGKWFRCCPRHLLRAWHHRRRRRRCSR